MEATMILTTTLSKIRASSPCTSGWKMLLAHLGKTEADDIEINLLTILESNGVQDMLWCLHATVQDSKRITSQLAIEFAEQALPIFEKWRPDDLRPRQAIQAARDYLDGKIDLAALCIASSSAASADYSVYSASAAAAASAATFASSAVAFSYSAASYSSAAAAFAYSAASYSSSAARAQARQKQADIIRAILSWPA